MCRVCGARCVFSRECDPSHGRAATARPMVLASDIPPHLTWRTDMPGSWIPESDGPLDVFVTNFSVLITAAPTSYGVVSADATAIASAVASWHAAFLLAVNPTTRT